MMTCLAIESRFVFSSCINFSNLLAVFTSNWDLTLSLSGLDKPYTYNPSFSKSKGSKLTVSLIPKDTSFDCLIISNVVE